MRRLLAVSLIAGSILIATPGRAASYLDVIYKTSPETLKLDVYTPSTGSNWPSVIIVHGGGWDDRKDWSVMGQDWAANGFAAFVIEYRLAPTWRSPAPVEDAQAALGWVRSHASEYGADGSNVVLFGGSAGAQIALAASLGSDKPEAVVGYSSITDLTVLPNDSQAIQYLGCTYSSCTAKWEDASVYLKADASFPPTFLAHGTTDTKVSVTQTTKFDTKLDSLGVRNATQLVTGNYHAQQLHSFVSVGMFQWVRDTLEPAPSEGTPSPSPSPSTCP